MVTEIFIGQMEEFIEEIGKMVNKMEKDFTKDQMVKKEKENGKMAKKSDGQMNESISSRINSSFFFSEIIIQKVCIDYLYYFTCEYYFSTNNFILQVSNQLKTKENISFYLKKCLNLPG